MGDKLAILGFHDQYKIDSIDDFLKVIGIPCLFTNTLAELHQLVQENIENVGYIVMDVNLGYRNQPVAEPAAEIWNLVKDRANIKYISVSGNRGAVAEAKRVGIPSYDLNFFNPTDFFQ